MELTKTKYKQTEVGLIPEDWECKKVGDIALTSAGGTPSTKHPSYWGGEIPWMNSGELNLKQVFNVENRITDEGLNNSSTKYIPKLSVLIGLAGQGKTRGTAAINHIELCTNQSIGAIYPSKYHDSFFMYYYIDYQYNELRKLSTGDGGRGGLNLSIIRNINFPLPPTLSEQKAIATALSDVDDLIANLELLITKKKAIKQGAMQQLLTPNEKWVNTSLIELAENKKNQFDDGDWIESEYIISQGVRLIQTGNIGIGVFKDKGNKKYISEESFNKLNCKEVLKGDLLICRLAEPAGRACVMPSIGEDKVVTSVDVSIFRGNQEVVNREFLSQIFTTNGWFQKVIEKVGGTTHKRISRGALGKINIEVPIIEEQKRIALVLSDMDAEIEQLETKKAKYQDIKQGMMQELLTGKTRLI